MDFYAGMLKIGLDKNYSKGWAYYAYKEKFGVFPNKRPEPASTPCEDAVKFAKYKQIRYSKRKEIGYNMIDYLENVRKEWR